VHPPVTFLAWFKGPRPRAGLVFRPPPPLLYTCAQISSCVYPITLLGLSTADSSKTTFILGVFRRSFREQWPRMLIHFAVVVVASEDASLTPLPALFTSLLSITSQLSIKMPFSLISALSRQISPWRREMIFSSRISDVRPPRSRASSQTLPPCSSASPLSLQISSSATAPA